VRYFVFVACDTVPLHLQSFFYISSTHPQNISGMAKAKDFKFCTLVDAMKMKYYPWDDKLSLKWARSWSRDQFLPRDAKLAWYKPSSCVCRSVCLSDCAWTPGGASNVSTIFHSEVTKFPGEGDSPLQVHSSHTPLSLGALGTRPSPHPRSATGTEWIVGSPLPNIIASWRLWQFAVCDLPRT